MTASSWASAVPADAHEVYARAGFGRRMPQGQRPAVIVIDVTYAFTGQHRLPLLESIDEWPLSCGPDGWDAVDRTAVLLERARAAGLPIYFTVGRREEGPTKRPPKFGNGAKAWAVPNGNDIVAEVAPIDGEVVIAKPRPSAFFDTELISMLRAQGVDSVILAGCTTSGCVRGTAVDGFSHDLFVRVVEDCVFDRSRHSHDVSLFEMDQKYADVVTLDDVLASLPEGLSTVSGAPQAS